MLASLSSKKYGRFSENLAAYLDAQREVRAIAVQSERELVFGNWQPGYYAFKPFFFKQWGGVHKKKNGRKLDGRMWNELPDCAGLKAHQ
jgi:hypothetical protein